MSASSSFSHIPRRSCQRRHVVLTTHPKIPGQVQDPSGAGNDDFDKGLKDSKFGYLILGLYKLRERLKAGKMREYGFRPPQGLVCAVKEVMEGVLVREMERCRRHVGTFVCFNFSCPNTLMCSLDPPEYKSSNKTSNFLQAPRHAPDSLRK